MAEKKICGVEGCGNPQHARGYCGKHNYKFVKYGDPLAGRRGASPGEPLRWIEAHVGHQDDGCLLWPFEIGRTGYGTVRHKDKRRVASRVMCEMAHGAPNDPAMDAAHSCHNPPCCNPRHLRWATRSENNLDMAENGTAMRGEKVVFSKLTEADIHEIRSLEGTMRQQDIADRFGVNATAVSRILSGKRWGWLNHGELQRPSGERSRRYTRGS